MSEDQSKKEFERWIKDIMHVRVLYKYGAEGSFPGQYCDSTTYLAWEAWLASRKECQNLLSEVAGCGISRTADGKYHDVQIPMELWDAIQEATQCERDKQKK